MEGLWDFASGSVSGIYNVVRHPVQTGKSLALTANNTYLSFRSYDHSIAGSLYHTAASGAVTMLGGGGLLSGYEAAQAGDIEEAARQFTSGTADAATWVVAACKIKDLARAGRLRETGKVVKTASNVENVSSARRVTRSGVTRANPSEWRKLRNLWDKTGVGDALSGGNRMRIAQGKTPLVDDKWVSHFPGDAALKGQKIPMHHIQGSRITVPLPER